MNIKIEVLKLSVYFIMGLTIVLSLNAGIVSWQFLVITTSIIVLGLIRGYEERNRP